MLDAPSASRPITIVTGAAGGIGSKTVERFVGEGGVVIAVDIAMDGIDAEGSVDPHVVDITDQDAVEGLFEAVVAEHGRIDNLVNCAGITRDSTIHKMSYAQWQEVLRVNLDAPFLMTRAMVRHIRERGDGGAVVNITSISGQVGTFGQANYAASKAGLVGLTKVTAREIARYGARANAISPGFIRSPMTDAIPEAIREERAASAPLARPGEPHEIAAIAAWLCSDDASFITGAVIDATGGRM